MLPSLESSDPERLADQLAAQLHAASWRWASTYAAWAPHWYSLKSTWSSLEAFAWCCSAIARLGVERVWKRQRYVYFDDRCPTCHQGFTYWVCPGEPVALINRARLKK
jgi:hypothetical protein